MFDPGKCLTSLEVTIRSAQVGDDGAVEIVTCTHELDYVDALAGQRAMSEYFSTYMAEMADKQDQRRAEQKAAIALWKAAETIVLKGYGEAWDGVPLSENRRDQFLEVPALAAHAVTAGNAASERLGGRVNVRPLAHSVTSSE